MVGSGRADTLNADVANCSLNQYAVAEGAGMGKMVGTISRDLHAG